jgi:hypothetical protein
MEVLGESEELHALARRSQSLGVFHAQRVDVVQDHVDCSDQVVEHDNVRRDVGLLHAVLLGVELAVDGEDTLLANLANELLDR